MTSGYNSSCIKEIFCRQLFGHLYFQIFSPMVIFLGPFIFSIRSSSFGLMSLSFLQAVNWDFYEAAKQQRDHKRKKPLRWSVYYKYFFFNYVLKLSIFYAFVKYSCLDLDTLCLILHLPLKFNLNNIYQYFDLETITQGLPNTNAFYKAEILFWNNKTLWSDTADFDGWTEKYLDGESSHKSTV